MLGQLSPILLAVSLTLFLPKIVILINDIINGNNGFPMLCVFKCCMQFTSDGQIQIMIWFKSWLSDFESHIMIWFEEQGFDLENVWFDLDLKFCDLT